MNYRDPTPLKIVYVLGIGGETHIPLLRRVFRKTVRSGRYPADGIWVLPENTEIDCFKLPISTPIGELTPNTSM